MTALEKFGQLPIMEQAALLSKSNLVPKAFRGKPADIVIALLWGEEVGLGPTSSLSYIDVIEGNATINAEGSNALIRRAGHSLTIDVTNDRAVVKGKRSDTGDEMTVTWTMQMAKDAGLANKQVWKQYPQAMLTSRAVSQISRALFADVFLGITYTPEEAASFAAPEVLDAQPEALAQATTGQAELPPPNVDAQTGEILDVVVDQHPTQAPKPRTFSPPRKTIKQLDAEAKSLIDTAKAVKSVDPIGADAFNALKARKQALSKAAQEQLRGDLEAVGLTEFSKESAKAVAEQVEALIAAAEASDPERAFDSEVAS